MFRVYDKDWNRVNPEESRNLNYKDIAAIFDREAKASGSVSGRPFSKNVWVYACVALISQTFWQIPLGLWRKTPGATSKRGYKRIETHPILDLLDQPNDFMDTETFLEAWASYLLTGGNVWIQIARDSTEEPVELLVWGADRVKPLIRSADEELIGWEVKVASSKKAIPVPLEDMIHTRLSNPYHRYMGLPPVASVALQIDTDYARTIFDHAFHKNNASPDAVLIYKPGPLGEEQRAQIRQSWNEFHAGPDKAGGLAIVGGDYDFKVWGLSHSAVQFLENRAFTREEIASVYNVPVTLLNAVVRNGLTREALTASNRSFYENAVFPLCARFKNSINRRIVKPIDQKLYFDFDTDRLSVMSSFLRDKAEVMGMFVKAGGAINDAIEALDLGFEPQEGGDKGYLPGNFVGIDQLAKAKAMQPPTESVALPKKTSVPQDKRVAILINKLGSEIKKQMFKLRSNTLKKNKVFDLEAAKNTWIRGITPICTYAVQLGADMVRGNGTWLDRAMTISEEELNNLFMQISANAENVHIDCDGYENEIVGLIGRSENILHGWHERLKATDNLEHDTIELFTGIHRESKQIARKLITWSINVGIYLEAARLNKPTTTNCECDYFGRYPGDFTVPESSNCACSLFPGVMNAT